MSAGSEVRLAREMSLTDITMIGVGAMIGAGIFVLTGIAAGVAGPGLLLAFLLNGVVTLFAAGAYAELGSSFHDAGGGYLWVKTGLPEPNGFLSGWMSWFAHAVACALYALGFGAYFKVVLPLLGVAPPETAFLPVEKWLAVGVVALFAYINYRGASETGKAGNVVTIAKIVVLAVFVALGIAITLRRPDWQGAFRDFLPNGFGGVVTAMGLTFIAFEGYEIIAQCSEEVREPKKNVPRAVFLSLLIVVPLYLLVAFAALGAVDVPGIPSWQYLGQQKETALVDVSEGFFHGGAAMLLVGGLLSTMSALNATIYSSSRVSFAMGRDRNLPTWFGKIHPKRKTPHWAILVSGILIAFMAAALPIEAVASAADIMFLLLFIQVLFVLVALRRKMPELDRGFRVPWVPVVPIVGIVLQAVLMVFLAMYSPEALVSAAAWIALGAGVFYLYARKRDRAYGNLLAAREAAEQRRYRTLACLAHPDRTAPILAVAGDVAGHFGGEVLALNVVEVPEGAPLAVGLDRQEAAGPLLEAARRRLEAAGVAARGLVKVAHRISYGIAETALEERCNLVILGRSRRASLLERLSATVVDRVVRSGPEQVVEVCAERWPSKIRTVAAAWEPGPHGRLVLDLAWALARRHEARLRLVHVVPEGTLPSVAREAEKDVRAALGEDRQAEVRIARSADVVQGILDATAGADVLVVGGTEAGVLEHLMSYAPPLELADRSDLPVLIAYEMADEPTRWHN